MKFENVKNVERLFQIIRDECSGTVELVSSEGDRINLKSRLSQYISMVRLLDTEFVKELERLILEDEHIIGVHDLIVHNYGPGRVFVSVHAEVPADMDILVAHDCVDMAERRIEKRMGCFISIHMDPVITDDEVINEQKAVVQEIIDDISPDISMHDFRTIKGPHITNLIFDVLVPFGFDMKDDEIVGRIKDALRNKHENWRAVIQVDKKMF